MTQQNNFTSNNKHKFSTGAKTALDANLHERNTVHAPGGLSPPVQEETMKDIQLLSINQVCAMLNMGRVKVYDLINGKRIRSVKIGARRLVSVRALNDFINRLEEEYGAQG